jgi:hypothetical protein
MLWVITVKINAQSLAEELISLRKFLKISLQKEFMQEKLITYASPKKIPRMKKYFHGEALSLTNLGSLKIRMNRN